MWKISQKSMSQIADRLVKDPDDCVSKLVKTEKTWKVGCGFRFWMNTYLGIIREQSLRASAFGF